MKLGSRGALLVLVALGSAFVCLKTYQARVFSENMPAQVTTASPKEFLSGITPVRGAGNPKYILLEFGDYQCPPCAKAAPQVASLLKKYPDKMAFVFRNFPLEKHPLAKQAATVAMACRQDYWNVHDQLYSYNAKLTPEILQTITKTHKLDGSALHLASANVALDQSVSKDFHVQSTPSFYVLSCNDKFTVYGPASLEQIDWMIAHDAG